VKVAGFRWC